MNDIYQPLPPLLNIMKTGNNLSPQNFGITCHLLGFISTELLKRDVADINDEVLNVPGRKPLETV